MAAHGLYWWDIRPDWSKIKFQRMKRVLFAKFIQHGDLRELLLSTGDARLVESGRLNNAVNRLWGEVNGRGQNMLGRLLIEVRTQLRSEHVQREAALRPPARRRKGSRQGIVTEVAR
jgi:hypothetical protein